MLNNFQAIVFDMDGLLLDSETIALATFVEACKECGYDLHDMEPYYKCIGTNWPKATQTLISGYGKDFPFDAISEVWGKKYHDETLTKPVPVKEGALQLLDYLEREGMRKVVVTSSRKENSVIKLTNAGLLNYFEFILGGNQIENGKPHPEMYLTAAEMLNVKPDKCLAIEDSDNGVLSAYNAGMTVIQVPDINQPSDKVKALGHTIMSSLTDIERLLKQDS
ncbi:MAG: HAD family phosphatase [Chloroflexi bacterium]|jgi:HAD superfamily hydrolase (TIGR01509 family)|nr:HAD family phosphatase [Chloroflexota bacterium]MBT7080986.1 HAD family phosphatase [Chloroflexota bacterium]MBT7290535.1 HAD family phosphatase [Chloroflexota bacterium]